MKQYTIFDMLGIPNPYKKTLEEQIDCKYARGYKAGYFGFNIPICRNITECKYQHPVKDLPIEVYLCGKTLYKGETE